MTPRASAIALLLGVVGVVALVSACARAPQLVAVADSTTAKSSTSNESEPSAPIGQSGTLPAQAGTQTCAFTVQTKEKLHVDIDRGEVLVSTWDKPQAKIVVTQKGRDIEEFLKHHTITITQENHEVRVKARADRSLPSSVSDVQIKYQISIPREFDADIAISLGRLELADLKGQVEARVSLGEVKLSKIDGPVNVQTSQGAIEVSDCTRGALRASVSQGWVEIKRFSGPAVNASVSQGNVGVEMTAAPTGDCSVTSSQGNVSVTLPATAGVNLTAATSMGTIHCDLPVKSQEHGVTGGSMQGPINGGGPALKLGTSMGNIRISKP
jgi:lia operon protein LiaG